MSEFPLAPVTALDWLPRFSILTQASGVGDDECGEDVVASINAYGYWQAGMSPAARPSIQQVRVPVWQFGHCVCCLFVACCQPRLVGCGPASDEGCCGMPLPTSVYSWIDRQVD